MEFSITPPPGPIRADLGPTKKKSSQCVRARALNNSTESDSVCAQVLSGQSQIHPELSKATDERLELSVLPPRKPLPRPKRKHIHYASPLSSCTNGKIGTAKGGVGIIKRREINGHRMSPGSVGGCARLMRAKILIFEIFDFARGYQGPLDPSLG